MSTYTQHYSNFIGVDLSSDARSVARNRLAYAVNMWRDYESEQGEAIETFPGFRRLIRGLGAVHGLFAYRAKSGDEYLVVHVGTRLYCFESESVAAKDDEKLTEAAALDKVELEDGDSQGFIFNNNLYILDGKHFVVVSSVTDKDGATSVTASDVNAYVPTTYYDGKPYEQRNMLVDEAKETTNPAKIKSLFKDGFQWYNFFTRDDIGGRYISGFSHNKKTPFIYCEGEPIYFYPESFKNETIVQIINAKSNNDIAFFGNSSFNGCKNLEKITLSLKSDEGSSCRLYINENAFLGCDKLKEFTVNIISGFEVSVLSGSINEGTFIGALKDGVSNGDLGIPKGVNVKINPNTSDGYPDVKRNCIIACNEWATSVKQVKRLFDDQTIEFGYGFEKAKGSDPIRIKEIYVNDTDLQYRVEGSNPDDEPQISGVEVIYELSPIHFSTIENVKNFHDGNPDYEGTGVEAINGCTKSAVFDGRIFLTGNPALPNTVFYSNRNLTGANDPTYWGAYNYFNDGDGNTPNVDLLSTPSMLMVLKNNTVQDGSVYYHVPAYNEDEYSRDLVPKIYPSTAGAAGIGSAGNTVPGTTACNFLDDPVFLSTRGLEAVGKQTVNLERTLTHRSSNIDRLLVKEDLSKASLAEWKGYLVICCDGRLYLADSRQMHQHPDGSYQYEWYYLEGLGCYEDYYGGYRYLDSWYAIDEEGHSLADCTLIGGRKLGDVYALSDTGKYEGGAKDILVLTAFKPDGSEFYFYASGNYALDPVDEERVGSGVFYPATKTLVIGERLFFGTAGGDVCVINTDKRGVSDDFDGDIGTDRISTRWYTFHGVSYPSICVTRLDDCSKKSLAKSTVPGTAVARFKMMPGSRVRANVSLNGRDFKKVGEAFVSRYDAADIRFDNFSFTENEDAVVVLRELTRNWVDKQYSFVSDGFREPFGLYELSYLYNVKGKIRI